MRRTVQGFCAWLNKARSMTANPLEATEHSDKQNDSAAHLAKLAGQALLFSALQQPLNGIVQLGSLGHIAAPQIISAPEQEAFGTKGYWAETLGSGVGMAAPFMASEFAVGKIGSALQDTKIGSSLADTAAFGKYGSITKSAIGGAVYGFAFTPSDPHQNLFESRLKSAAVTAATFGTQRAVSLGLMHGLETAPATSALLDSTVGKTAARFGSNLASGALAGALNPNLDSLLTNGTLAGKDNTYHSMVAFAATGGAMDIAHSAISFATGNGATTDSAPSKAGETSKTDAQAATGGKIAAETKTAPAAETRASGNAEESAKAGGGSGAMLEIQKRLEQGSEADRQNEGERGSRAVIDRASAFIKTADSAVDKTTLSAAEKGQLQQSFRTLTEQMKVREWDTQGMDPKEIASTFDAVDRVLHGKLAVHLSEEQRVTLAKQMMEQAAAYPAPDTGNPQDNDVLAIMQTLQYKYPGSTNNAIADLLSTGKYKTPGNDSITVDLSKNLSQLADHSQGSNETYMQQLMRTLGTASIADTASNKIDTPQLQLIYERLSGTEKGGSVLKNGSTFVLRDNDGTFRVYRDDTNYIRWQTRVNGQPLEMLHADISKGYEGTFVQRAEGKDGNVTVTNKVLVHDNGVDQQLHIANPTDSPVNLTLAQTIDTPMRDIFEDRGWTRTVKGTFAPPLVDQANGSVTVNYTGLDGNEMSAGFHIAGMKPQSLDPKGFSTTFTLAPGEARDLQVDMKTAYNHSADNFAKGSFEKAAEAADGQYEKWQAKLPNVQTDSPVFNAMWSRVMHDMYILRQPTPKGEAIAAGIPWFACAFGRDDLITAKQMLTYNPDLAKSVLRTLAAYQGTEDDPKSAQKPGKIMHELRVGEMGRNHEIPFAPYYGTVDATPLFLDLLADYTNTTGDTSLFKELQPNVNAALDFLNKETKNGTDYLRYGSTLKEALSNQGWKDSGDSVSNNEGDLVQAPIALSEVQGYLYDAWTKVAQLQNTLAAEAKAKGDAAEAAKLEASAQELTSQAEHLKSRFQTDFWMPKKNFVALALDGKNQQADVVSSDPGHILAKPGQPGLLTPEQNQAVIQRLMAPDMFNGFGIKTLSSTEARHFDNSYHNGSVWPHDNSMIAGGLPPVDKLALFNGMFQLAQHDPNLRLPELIGGYPKDKFASPVPYPVACVPQAWAVGTMPSMLAHLLGIEVNGAQHELHINSPLLPDGVNSLQMDNLNVGGNKVDLHFSRVNGQTQVQVLPNAASPADLSKVKVSITQAQPSVK